MTDYELKQAVDALKAKLEDTKLAGQRAGKFWNFSTVLVDTKDLETVLGAIITTKEDQENALELARYAGEFQAKHPSAAAPIAWVAARSAAKLIDEEDAS